MRKLEYFLWFARAGVNQLAPYSLVSYFSHTGDLAAVAELAAVFAAVGMANLTRSGAMLSTVHHADLRVPFWMELIYSVAFTLPLIAILPQLDSGGVKIVTGILLVSGISGVYSSRIDIKQGLARLAVMDMSCVIVVVPVALALMGASAKIIAIAFLLRELVFCITVGIASSSVARQLPSLNRASFGDFLKSRLGGTLFWVAGPWKDYFITNVGLAFYDKTIYGAFYTTQLYWSLPVLVLGLLLRPAYKDVQEGRLSISALQLKIASFVFVSGLVLFAIDQLYKVIPETTSLVQLAVLLPLLMAAPVTGATMAAVSANDMTGIVVQNIVWAVTGCFTLYALKGTGLDGIAYSVIAVNIASILILLRKWKNDRGYISGV